jgi:UDP-N-acetylglucosamine 4-epimerase
MYSTPYHTTDLSKEKILITGGAGFIGSHLAEYLLKHGAAKVRVIDNFITGRKENVELFRSNPNYEFIEGDICNAVDCARACDGMTLLLHQAALGSVPRSIKDPLASNRINVDGFLNMLIAARDAGIKRTVYASSSSVYGDHPGLPKVEDKIGKQLSPYAVTKYANELYAHVFGLNYGMKLIGLRYFNIFGPRQDPNGQYAAVIPKWIDLLKKNERPIINGDGSNTRDFTFIENAVQANIKALTTENENAFGHVYNIACGYQFSLLELFNALKEIIGANIEPILGPARAGDIPQSLADVSKAKNNFGYSPDFGFRDGLKITVK